MADVYDNERNEDDPHEGDDHGEDGVGEDGERRGGEGDTSLSQKDLLQLIESSGQS